MITEADLAADFGISEKKAAELRRTKKWPHVRLGRFDIRYTDDQVEQIKRLMTVTPKPTSIEPAMSGQTKRSAARSA